MMLCGVLLSLAIDPSYAILTLETAELNFSVLIGLDCDIGLPLVVDKLVESVVGRLFAHIAGIENNTQGKKCGKVKTRF